MKEMVERVAQAIALAGNGGTWDDWYNDEQREFHRKRARSAIAAMREPTDEMLTAEGVHTNCPMCGGYEEGWKRLIDVVLADDKATKAA